MAAVSETCCVCSCDVSAGTNKTKRRKVYGEAGKVALGILDNLAIVHFRRSFSSCVTDCDGAFFCYKCRGRTEGYGELWKKMKSAEEELLSLISKVLQIGRKRANDSEGSTAEAQANKIVRQEDNMEAGSSKEAVTNDSVVSINIKWPSGQQRNFPITTPERQKIAKSLARKSLTSFSSATLNSESVSQPVINRITKLLRDEMKGISSDKSNSIILDNNEGVRQFRWSSLFHELNQKMPVMVKVLSSLVVGSDDNHRTILVCFIISVLLKNRFPKMALAQRAISILLYGNGCSKQVYNCLQPLMVCLSHTGTLKLVDRLAEDHDVKVQFWMDDLLPRLQTLHQSNRTHLDAPHWESYDESHDDSNEETEETILSELVYDETIFDDWDDDVDCSTQDASIEPEEVSECSDLVATVETTRLCEEDEVVKENVWNGFKIVGDNLDKNFRRTYQRTDFTTVSHHFFHMYAVKDRVNLSELSDTPKEGIIDVPNLLPSKNDHSKMREEFSILLSRVLVQHLTQFKTKAKSVMWHIPHKNSAEMKMKSTIVPLGIELKNENKTDEMCAILDSLHKYVPSFPVTESVKLSSGDTYETNDHQLYPILFGGDQLTAARIRSAISIRGDHDTSIEKLQGFLPVAEDWHCRMTLLKVIWTRLFSSKSACDKGTLFQIKNVIHRTAVPNDPKDNVQATEDFLEVVLVAYIVTAAENEYVDEMDLREVCDRVINKYVNLGDNNIISSSKDSMFLYVCELLTLGLIWWNYYDAIKEGDGERVLRIWKYLMIIFKETGHRNYAKEAALLLVQFNCTSSDRVAAQLMSSRFINTKGRVGCNIPCDLFMEHLNRRLKGIITKMESNVKPSSICRAAKVIGIVEEICRSFNTEMERKEESDKHKKPSYLKDLKQITDVIKQYGILCSDPNRKLNCKSVSLSKLLFSSVNLDKVQDWIMERIVPHFL